MAYATKYYSPRLDRALISRLYHEAKAQHVAMTVLANRLVSDGLSRFEQTGLTHERIVAEESPEHASTLVN